MKDPGHPHGIMTDDNIQITMSVFTRIGLLIASLYLAAMTVMIFVHLSQSEGTGIVSTFAFHFNWIVFFPIEQLPPWLVYFLLWFGELLNSLLLFAGVFLSGRFYSYLSGKDR